TAGVLVSDTFTGTGLLTAHIPDVNLGGGTWTVTGGTPIPTLNGGVVGVSGGSGHLQATLESAASNVRVAVDLRAGATQPVAAIVFRLTDANNHLLLMFNQNALHFYRRQAVTYTLLGSSGPLSPLVNGNTRRLELRASGSQLTGWWNGVRVLTVAETFNQNATQHGLDWNSASDATTTFDNLEIRNIGAP